MLFPISVIPSATKRSETFFRRHGIAPAPERSQTTTWKDFIAAHMAVLTGIDFFTVEVLTWRGLATYYVLFFLQLESRRVNLAGMTGHPDKEWMEQVGPERGRRRLRLPAKPALRAPRSGHEILRCIHFDPGIGRREVPGSATPQPEFEFLFGALGAIGKRRMRAQANPVRRRIATTSAHGVCDPLSFRAEPSR